MKIIKDQSTDNTISIQSSVTAGTPKLSLFTDDAVVNALQSIGILEFKGNDATGDASHNVGIRAQADTSFGDLYSLRFYTKNNALDAATDPTLTLSYEGNVGIGLGTANPSENLHIISPTNDSSTIRLEEGTGNFAALIGVQYNTNNLLNTGVAGSLCLRSLNAKGIGFSGTNSNLDMFINGSGNVGMGTSSPGASLHVEGGNGITARFFRETTSATATVLEVRSNNISANRLVWVVDSDGDASKISDKTVKTEISSFDGLSKVNAIHPKYYYKYGSLDHKEYGYFAQDVAVIYPEAVKSPDEERELYMMNYQAMIPILHKAIQELSAELDAAKARIDTLESV